MAGYRPDIVNHGNGKRAGRKKNMSPEQEQTIEANQLARQGGATVEQLMTAAPVCVRPETSAIDIIKLIYTKPFHHLLVIDANDALVGVLSDRDIVRCFCRSTTENGSGIAGITASDIMSTNIETVAPDTPLKEAVAMMKELGISSLPVLAGPKLVGILTDSDLWSLLHTLLGIMEERHGKT